AMLAVRAARIIETNRIGALPDGVELTAKVRSLAKPVPITLEGPLGDGAEVVIRFASPEYGVAPGQAANAAFPGAEGRGLAGDQRNAGCNASGRLVGREHHHAHARFEIALALIERAPFDKAAGTGDARAKSGPSQRILGQTRPLPQAQPQRGQQSKPQKAQHNFHTRPAHHHRGIALP
ncbi:hypothetical protein E4T56_gene203, partial [Termitomyces sp. T112]